MCGALRVRSMLSRILPFVADEHGMSILLPMTSRAGTTVADNLNDAKKKAGER